MRRNGKRTRPVPMLFTDLLATIPNEPTVVSAIEELRDRKIAGEELDRGPAIPIITDFVSSELARLGQLHPERKVRYPGLEPLNTLFRTVLSETFERAG